MSVKLPKCAFCGKDIARARKGFIRIDLGDFPGRPVLAWHPECVKQDRAVFDEASAPDGKTVEAYGVKMPWAAVVVWKRCPDRVSARTENLVQTNLMVLAREVEGENP